MKQYYIKDNFWFKYDLGQKYDLALVRTHGPPDHDSAFHVTETPALATGTSVTSLPITQTWTTNLFFLQTSFISNSSGMLSKSRDTETLKDTTV